MLDDAIDTLSKNEKPMIHSDRGSHYRWPGWLERINASGLLRSMLRKGCSPDNAACEGFFGRTKNEMYFAGTTMKDFMCHLDRYISWYYESRIKTSLGAMRTVRYRQHLGAELNSPGKHPHLTYRIVLSQKIHNIIIMLNNQVPVMQDPKLHYCG